MVLILIQIVRTKGYAVFRLGENFIVTQPELRFRATVIPKYWRERIVQVVDGRLRCSCEFHTNFMLPCRHILAVNQWRLSLEDVHFRWLVQFSLRNLKRERSFEDAICNPKCHLSTSEVLSLPECKVPLSWRLDFPSHLHLLLAN